MDDRWSPSWPAGTLAVRDANPARACPERNGRASEKIWWQAKFEVSLINMDSTGAAPRAYVMRGRALTTAQTGERILAATIELFTELPFAQLTLAAVAARAGVTVQTVIRRFGDKEGLIAAAAAHGAASISTQRDEAPVGDIDAIVDNLVEHYEVAGDLALRLLAEEESSTQAAAMAKAGRDYHRAWCARVFAPSLDGLAGVGGDRRLAQLVAVCDVYTWKLLRRDAGLSRRQVTLALRELLEPLTSTAPPRP